MFSHYHSSSRGRSRAVLRGVLYQFWGVTLKAGETYCLHIWSDLAATAVSTRCILSSKPNSCRGLHFFFFNPTFFSHNSLCFLISPSSSPISLFFSLLIPIKACWLGLDFSSTLPRFPLFLLCCSFLFLLYTFLSLFGYSKGSEEWCHSVTCTSPEAKDVFDKYLHFHLGHRVRVHKLGIIYSDIRLWVLAQALAQNLFLPLKQSKLKFQRWLQKEQ